MTPGLITLVAASVGISSASARRISMSAAHRYKIYSIPKKKGGVRIVAQPAREVKALQRALVLNLRGVLPVHPAAMAYESGRSIKLNAYQHRRARYLLKLDFSDFFPSIGPSDLEAHVLAHVGQRISASELNFILDLTLWRDARGRRCLCIGAPSSPFISNSVLHEFDKLVTRACEELDVVYTRYSDDLAFSCESPGVLAEVEARVVEILTSIAYPRLALNGNKRKAVSRATGMYVTGLTLSNQGDVTVGRVRKRGVRAGVQRYLSGQLDEDDIRRLKGELAFVISVEPDFTRVLFNTYGARVAELV